jgi:hypothetical protein
MIHLRQATMRVLSLSMFLVSRFGSDAQDASVASAPFSGWLTNGPAVYRTFVQGTQVVPGPRSSFPMPHTDLPPDVRRAMVVFRAGLNVTVVTNLSRSFDHFLPESLNNVVWTNFIAHTNGRNTVVWNVRSHPDGWPNRPPVVQWNPNGLMTGMRGLTALSPCWQEEGSPGQVPITALTRRHGYTRGHDMGPDHIGAGFAGKKVWFLTDQNSIVQTSVAGEAVRTSGGSGRDYTILLLSTDLPDSIQPMRVASQTDVLGPSPSHYPLCPGAPTLLFKTEQSGQVSADLPGFNLNTFKGGDSGSPNMLPLPGELVFSSGRSTSGASVQMQADMDELCRQAGLDPARYQLQWVDLSAYPAY